MGQAVPPCTNETTQKPLRSPGLSDVLDGDKSPNKGAQDAVTMPFAMASPPAASSPMASPRMASPSQAPPSPRLSLPLASRYALRWEASTRAEAQPAAPAAAHVTWPLGVAAGDKMDIFDTCGDAVIELSGSLVVQRLLDHLAYGCKAGELVGRSIVSCIHPNHQKAFEQTAIALLAMPSPPRAVRMLHSVFYKRSGSRAEVIVTALRPRMLG